MIAGLAPFDATQPAMCRKAGVMRGYMYIKTDMLNDANPG